MDAELQRVRHWGHGGEPDDPGDGLDAGDGGEPGGDISDHGERRGKRQLHDQLREWRADGDASGADGDGGQPDEGLRHGEPDVDGELRRVRQWRHGGEPDHPGDGLGDGDGGERGGDVSDHGEWRGERQLHHQLCEWNVDGGGQQRAELHQRRGSDRTRGCRPADSRRLGHRDQRRRRTG